MLTLAIRITLILYRTFLSFFDSFPLICLEVNSNRKRVSMMIRTDGLLLYQESSRGVFYYLAAQASSRTHIQSVHCNTTPMLYH